MLTFKTAIRSYLFVISFILSPFSFADFSVTPGQIALQNLPSATIDENKLDDNPSYLFYLAADNEQYEYSTRLFELPPPLDGYLLQILFADKSPLLISCVLTKIASWGWGAEIVDCTKVPSHLNQNKRLVYTTSGTISAHGVREPGIFYPCIIHQNGKRFSQHIAIHMDGRCKYYFYWCCKTFSRRSEIKMRGCPDRNRKQGRR